jgi:hypothetical protein
MQLRRHYYKKYFTGYEINNTYFIESICGFVFYVYIYISNILVNESLHLNE